MRASEAWHPVIALGKGWLGLRLAVRTEVHSRDDTTPIRTLLKVAMNIGAASGTRASAACGYPRRTAWWNCFAAIRNAARVFICNLPDFAVIQRCSEKGFNAVSPANSGAGPNHFFEKERAQLLVPSPSGHAAKKKKKWFRIFRRARNFPYHPQKKFAHWYP